MTRFGLIHLYDECPTGSVTFGDGKQAKIVGCGVVKTPGIPCLENVLLVDGLRANLISVSQVVDDHEEVRFNRKSCIVLDECGNGVLGGKRSKEDCYLVCANKSVESQTCLYTTTDVDQLTLWHRRLCHLKSSRSSEAVCQRSRPRITKAAW